MISGSQLMFTFPNMLEAGNALSIIKKYGFTKTCFVGRPNPSLQYMRKDGGTTGAFELLPSDAAAIVKEHLNYVFTWTVPPPLNWHDLRTLRLRVRDDSETILALLCDTANGTLSLFDEKKNRSEHGHPIGSNAHLETSQATVYLAETSLVGSGPTGPSVTLNLALSFKHQATDRLFAVEVGASDDLGHVDDFAHAGWVTVQPKKGASVPPEPEPEVGEGP